MWKIKSGACWIVWFCHISWKSCCFCFFLCLCLSPPLPHSLSPSLSSFLSPLSLPPCPPPLSLSLSVSVSLYLSISPSLPPSLAFSYALPPPSSPLSVTFQHSVLIWAVCVFVHSYVLERGVCYLVLCDKAFSKRLAFTYLEDLQNEFQNQYGTRVHTVSRPYSFIEFGQCSFVMCSLQYSADFAIAYIWGVDSMRTFDAVKHSLVQML